MNYAGEPYPVDPYEPCSMNYADSTDPRSGTGKAQYIEDFYSGKFN
jgi:hypothetical protein